VVNYGLIDPTLLEPGLKPTNSNSNNISGGVTVANDAEFQEFFLNLPADPEEAFVVYLAHEEQTLQDRLESNSSGWWAERKFYDAITAFDEVYGLNMFPEYHGDPPTDDSAFATHYNRLRRLCEKLGLKIKLERARRSRANDESLLVLDHNAKEALRRLVDAIRTELDKSPLSENKKSSLFKKLDAFATELDQTLTRTEAFFAFAAESAKAFREVSAEFAPLAERIDRVIDMIDNGPKWLQQLPPWSERKKLSGPQKQLPKPGNNEPNFVQADDDIPF